MTWQALQAHGFEAKVYNSCIRPPPFAGRGEFYATNDTTHEMVSDEDPETFWKAARTATTIHRYDPNAPFEPGPRLPWPYHRMTCDEISSGNVPALPKGMKEIPISYEMREALVSVLIKHELRERRFGDFMERGKPNRVLLGDVVITPPRLDQFTSAIDEVGQMLRDAIRSNLPTVKRAGAGPDDDEISIIDTKTGQVLGGIGAGGTLSFAPGGVFIADALKSSNAPQPTREFMLGQGFGEMGGGLVQVGAGTGMGAGGAGLSLTGGGAVIGLPTCAAGVTLAANGAVTFLHGANTVLIALCHWEELPAAPEAAASSMDTPPAATNAGAPPSAANGGSAIKPAINTAPTTPLAKPAITPPQKPASAPIATQAKSAPTTPPVPEAPPPGTTVVHKSASGTTTSTRRRIAPGEKPPAETTTITTTEGGGTTISTTRTRQAPGDAANGVAKGAKRGPKTDPDAPHNAARRKDAEKLKAEGNRIIAGGGDDKEMLVQTPGGIKSARRPDTILLTPKGERRGRNYGRTNADGTPVKREQEALDDLNNHSDTPTDFVPYDR